MEDNRINFAKYQIYKYVDDLFVCISDLVRDDLDELMNMPSHGLSEKELEILLYELFSEFRLVAMKHKKGLFTPTLNEIEEALKEEKDFMSISKNTFYGITTGAIEEFRALEQIYDEKT